MVLWFGYIFRGSLSYTWFLLSLWIVFRLSFLGLRDVLCGMLFGFVLGLVWVVSDRFDLRGFRV